ncbi:MAG: MarR family transcriptional regulator [Cyanobacteria bacterium P01_H01_bin.105]
MRTRKGDLLTELVLEIFKLNGLLISEGDHISGKCGLSSARWKVLGSLALSENPLTVAQIARMMGQARQSVQRIANDMAKSGYFIWEDNPADKRAKLLKITEKGKRAYKLLDSAQAPWANESAKQLDMQDLKSALIVLRQLIDHFGTSN